MESGVDVGDVHESEVGDDGVRSGRTVICLGIGRHLGCN